MGCLNSVRFRSRVTVNSYFWEQTFTCSAILRFLRARSINILCYKGIGICMTVDVGGISNNIHTIDFVDIN